MATRQLSTSIFGRSSITDETPPPSCPPCHSLVAPSQTKTGDPTSNLLFHSFDSHSWWFSLTLCRSEATTTTRAGESRHALNSSCFVASIASSSAACKGVLTFVLNHPPVFSIFVRFDLALLSLPKVCCRNRALSAACVWWCMRVRVAEDAWSCPQRLVVVDLTCRVALKIHPARSF